MLPFRQLAILLPILAFALSFPLVAEEQPRAPAVLAIEAQALASLTARADAGDAAASVILYRKLLVSTATLDDWARGRIYLQQAASAGVVEAQLRLAELKQNGQFGVARDLPGALALAEAAVLTGDNNARRSLAGLLMGGQVPPDPERAVALLEAAIATGNVDAASMLAGFYARGQRVRVDTEKAAELYQFGIASGNTGAFIGLADMYRISTTPAFDPAKARLIFEQFAPTDNNAAKRLADMMVKGEGMPADFSGGVALLESLKTRNDFSGLITIGDYYQRGTGTAIDGAKAAQYFQQAAENGIRDGRVRLAQIQRAGLIGLPADPAAALASFRLAAEAGDINSRRTVAEMTARGEGTQADVAAAIAMLEAAAADGDASAWSTIGDFYSRGDVVYWDAPQALEYYSRAAQAGQVNGLIRSAEIYRGGLPGFPADMEKAVAFYEQAIALGDLSAKRSLADLLLNGGNGLDADPDRAVALLEEGIASGDASAAQQLGNIFSSGRPLDPDYDRAMAAFDRSVALGNPGARLRKGAALLQGPLAEDHAEEGVALIRSAIADGIPGATFELARAQMTGQVPGATVDDGRATLAPLVAANDVQAIRYLIQLYRDGISERFEPDLAAAKSLIAEKSALLGPESTVLETAYVDLMSGTSPAVYDAVIAALPALRPNNAISLATRLFDVSQNGYVYLLQNQLQQRGLFDGTISGTLNQPTISALNTFCDDSGIREECSKGPLDRGVATTILRAMFLPG